MKTIFFTFSSQTVLKNLFLFPGSVFDKTVEYCQTHTDIRFVFLMPDGYQAYIEFMKGKMGNTQHIEMEIIPSMSKNKTFLQRSFYFFYSYFVYTGTTAVMATIGIRPDEPPGGGRFKKYLGPVKILISKTFGKSHWMRTRLVPSVYMRLHPERPFQEVFDRYKPDMVFIPHLYGRFDLPVLAESKRRGIKTAGMISNWDHFDKYYLPFQTDVLLAQSDQIKRFALDYQSYRPEQIRVVGYAHFDYLTNDSNHLSRKEVLDFLKFPQNSKYLMYISGSAYSRDEPEIIEEILKWIDEGKFGPDVRLCIRPYLGTRPDDRDIDKIKFDRFKEHPKVAMLIMESWKEVGHSRQFISVMKHADVVLVVYSTAALEAAVFDRPLVAPTFDGYQKRPFAQSIRRFEVREHFKDVLQTGALRPAYNFDELYSLIDAYLKNPAFEADKRQLLRDQLCYKTDNKSAERTFEAIIREV